MNQDQPMCSRTPRRDGLNRKIKEIKTALYLFFHGLFWKFLFSIGLGWKFHQFMCRTGLSAYRNNHCTYCGRTKEEHKSNPPTSL